MCVCAQRSCVQDAIKEQHAEQRKDKKSLKAGLQDAIKKSEKEALLSKKAQKVTNPSCLAVNLRLCLSHVKVSKSGLDLYPETSPEILWLVWAACSCLFMFCCSSARSGSTTTECKV